MNPNFTIFINQDNPNFTIIINQNNQKYWYEEDFFKDLDITCEIDAIIAAWEDLNPGTEIDFDKISVNEN